MGSIAPESAPPAPTPEFRLSTPQVGIEVLQPLTRRRHGPGLIVLVDEATAAASAVIKDKVPSILTKWAEEGYVVAQLQPKAWTESKDPIRVALDAISGSQQCDPKGSVGLVSYDPDLWHKIAPSLSSYAEIKAAVIYDDALGGALVEAGIPTVRHSAGKAKGTLSRTADLTEYEYPSMSTYRFSIPFQKDFSYSQEAVSHTRSLTFLKPRMKGPYFDLEAIWDEHTSFEFAARSVEHTMATMVEEPYVNHIPTMTGGIGRERLSNFYRHHFVFNNPDDTEIEPISRTIGIDRVVDEFIFKFTHNKEVDWLLPGMPPTGKYLELPFTSFVNIRGDRLYHEHIGWCQATALRQAGLLPAYLPFPYPLADGQQPASGKHFEYKLPTSGREIAEKLRDKNSGPSNEMFEYKVREVDD